MPPEITETPSSNHNIPSRVHPTHEIWLHPTGPHIHDPATMLTPGTVVLQRAMSPEVETKQIVERQQIARFLHQLADGMEGSEPVRLSIEGRPVTIDPPEKLEFDVEIEDEPRRLRRGKRSLEIELAWKQTDGDRPLQG